MYEKATTADGGSSRWWGQVTRVALTRSIATYQTDKGIFAPHTTANGRALFPRVPQYRFRAARIMRNNALISTEHPAATIGSDHPLYSSSILRTRFLLS